MEDELAGSGKKADDYLADCIKDMQMRKLGKRRAGLLEEYNSEKNEEKRKDLLNSINRISREIREKKESLN
ncbi:hypothetical protein SDC9_198307 [bioreactor metagenome]|uniref:Uncharacterized protein n=1 Tax=bioreactor metagenome TaxID=1076179 RepID=A0A645IHB7_9ZZZZ